MAQLSKDGHQFLFDGFYGFVVSNQRGGSIVTLVTALPLILLLLCAVLDLGRLVFLHMELENAAMSLCRSTEEGLLANQDEDALVVAACTTSPSLGVTGLSLSADLDFEDPEEKSYIHRLYSREDDEFIERISHTREQPFEVVLSLEGMYLTPVGGLVATTFGGADRFELVAQAAGCRDETAEGGVW